MLHRETERESAQEGDAKVARSTSGVLLKLEGAWRCLQVEESKSGQGKREEEEQDVQYERRLSCRGGEIQGSAIRKRREIYKLPDLFRALQPSSITAARLEGHSERIRER